MYVYKNRAMYGFVCAYACKNDRCCGTAGSNHYSQQQEEGGTKASDLTWKSLDEIPSLLILLTCQPTVSLHNVLHPYDGCNVEGVSPDAISTVESISHAMLVNHFQHLLQPYLSSRRFATKLQD
jgi:hypothetical protein